MESIAIDKRGTRLFEQTYSYDVRENCIWIHIICPIRYFTTFEEITEIITRNNISRNIRFFGENVYEQCISVKVSEFDSQEQNNRRSYEENLNNELCLTQVKLVRNYTFEVCDDIYFGTEDQEYIDWIRNIVRIGHDLRRQRTGSEKINFLDNDDSFSLSSAIISELSVFFSTRVGRYMSLSEHFSDFYRSSEFRFIRLFASEFQIENERRLSLQRDLEESFRSSAFYSDLINERLRTFQDHRIIENFTVPQTNNIKTIEIFSSAFELIISKCNFNYESFESVRKSVREIWRVVIDRVFPQFLYFEHKIRSYRPEHSAFYMFYTIQDARTRNLFNFDANSKFYAKLTEPVKEAWNLVFIFLIYQSLNNYNENNKNNGIIYRSYQTSMNRCVEIQNQVRTENERQRRADNNDRTKEAFRKKCSFYGVIQTHREDPNNDIVISFKFPHIQTYFRQPINYYLNLTKVFQKYLPQYDRNNDLFQFCIKIFFSDNDLQHKNSEVPYRRTINLEKWTKTISISDFNRLYKLSIFSPVNKEVYELKVFKINNDIQRNVVYKSIEIINLEINLDFKIKGLVFAVQANPDSIYRNVLNNYDNYDYEQSITENPNGMDPTEQPDIEILHLTRDFHYCFIHHSNAIKYDFIWVVKNVFLKEDEKNKFKVSIKTNEITRELWLEKRYRLNKVCLSLRQDFENELVNSDKKFVKVFHGSIDNFDFMLKYYASYKNIPELELILDFGNLFSKIEKNRKYDIEFIDWHNLKFETL
jgi:hypothetical protein